LILGLVCFGALALHLRSASAETPLADLVLQKVAALEARVAALETKNREYKREAEEARAQVRAANERSPKISRLVPSRIAAAAMAYSVAGPTDRAVLGWTGAYWGASAGGAATRSAVVSDERDTQNSGGGTFGYDVHGTSTTTSGAGALIDVFAGWNTQISNLVIGAQAEATFAGLNFSSAGSRTYTYFTQAGPSGAGALADFRPQIASRWMTSALLRAGVLLNDQTLVYAIGGWTGAQFEARNLTDNPFYQPVETFWANGWTAGGGIEHKLDSNWSVRAEYRYTDFGTVRTSDHYLFTTLPPPSSSQTSDRQTQYTQSIQTGRIGFAYAINPQK
jgi:opacity protein-like surface antigen